MIWHEKACLWLLRSFLGVCRANGWLADRHGEIVLPATRDLIEPDLAILRDAASLPDGEHQRPVDRVLLVAEVTSPASIRDDREVKPRGCALAGIPFYLLVDRFASPLTVSVFSRPGANGYATVTSAPVGESVHIPAPFDVSRVRDTSVGVLDRCWLRA